MIEFLGGQKRSKLRIAHLIWLLCLHVLGNYWPNYNNRSDSHVWLNNIDTAQRLKECLHVSEQLSKVYQSHAMDFPPFFALEMSHCLVENGDIQACACYSIKLYEAH